MFQKTYSRPKEYEKEVPSLPLCPTIFHWYIIKKICRVVSLIRHHRTSRSMLVQGDKTPVTSSTESLGYNALI